MGQTLRQFPLLSMVAIGFFGFGEGAFAASSPAPATGPGPESAWAALRSAIGPDFDARLAQLKSYAQRRDDDPAVVAQTCLAFVALEERTRDGSFAPQLVELANSLVAKKDLNHDGRVGWGVSPKRPPGVGCEEPGQIHAFGDGTCNEANREYAFETGLAAMCLARAYLVTSDLSYREAAKQALDDSWDIGIVPDPCPGCFYYWYSYDANDVGRYVRKSNVLMGAAAAWVWKATGDARYRSRAEQVLASERRESEAGNGGYFGIDDWQYQTDSEREAQRVENHVPWISKGLLDIGRILNDQSVVDLALAVQDAWQSCSGPGTCQDNCAVWGADPKRCHESATASPCFFKGVNTKMASLCEAALPTLLRGAMTPAMWWAVVEE